MQLAELITSLDDGRFRCDACQWRCVLGVGEVGKCQLRVGTAEGIEVLNHSMISNAAIGPIEDHRLWHFFPDSLVLAVGSFGYTFPADQQRGPHALLPEDEAKRRRLPPDRAARVALDKLCRGVVWSYSDPAVSHEYVRDAMQLARAESRYTAVVTNGFMTIEALDAYGHYLHGLSLELRGFSDASYARLAGVPDWRGVLELAKHALTRWGCHIEVTTRIHHGVNDNPDELKAMVQWIVETLGAQTPWHVLPGDAGVEAASAVMRARRIGHDNGLQFIYGSETNQATRCPKCQSTLITRVNGVAKLVGLNEQQCSNCGEAIKLHLSIFRQR
jgi:pyruvate formate lyase activating enzyme